MNNQHKIYLEQLVRGCLERAEKLIARRLRPGMPRREATLKGYISSLGTARDYKYCLSSYFQWLDFCGIDEEEQDHRQHLTDYLEDLAESVSQSTINQHRQALQRVFQVGKLPFVRATQQSELLSRSYSWSEVKIIAQYQSPKNALATLIAYSGGLRAHELATLIPADELPRSFRRKWRDDLFIGFPTSKLFSVIGKGGLIRNIAIPITLANQLDQLRWAPRLVKDRGVHYMQHYDIGFGQAFSQSFSYASFKALGFSFGVHGLRHSYVKRRISQLLTLEVCLADAQLIVSQEVGHFRPSITFCYMR